MQALFSLSLTGLVTPVGGLLQFVPIVGTALGTGVWAAGIVLGIAINISLSLTMGVGHMYASLLTFHHTSPSLKTKLQALFLRRVLIFFFGEIIPVINNLPWLSIATVLMVRSAYKEEKKEETRRKLESAPAPAPAALPVPALRFSDIRPPKAANDNTPLYAKTA